MFKMENLKTKLDTEEKKTINIFEKIKKMNSEIIKSSVMESELKCSMSPDKSKILTKKRSKTHEISDSESESDHNDDGEIKLKKIKTSSTVSHHANKIISSPIQRKNNKCPNLDNELRSPTKCTKDDSKSQKRENKLTSSPSKYKIPKNDSKCQNVKNKSSENKTSPDSQSLKRKHSERHEISNSESDDNECSHHSVTSRTSVDLPMKSFAALKNKTKCNVDKTSSLVTSALARDYNTGEKRKPDSTLTREKTIILTGSSEDNESISDDCRPLCKYGSDCYRKSESHLKEFRHSGPLKMESGESPFKKARTEIRNAKKNGFEIYNENQPFSFFLTKVTGIDDKHNQFAVIHIKDILSPSMGNLVESCQFNYMIDIDWLVKQYPKEFRKLPLTIVHGQQRSDLASLLAEASSYPNITCCQAKLEMYGTHHSKMMFLMYDNGMRVVIHTANLYEDDWYQKTQGAWISPLFPKMDMDVANNSSELAGDSATNFKKDLLEYLATYKSSKMRVWEKHVQNHDMSSAKVFIIGSVPGRHIYEKKNNFGHLKLRKVLRENGPNAADVKNWPVIGQFSSIGSLGPTKDNWLCKEWLQSLSTTRGTAGPSTENNLLLVFPSVNNVRLSLEGYGAGGSLPYQFKTAKKQLYLHKFFRQWKSEGRGRSCASPHIKTYIRPSPDFTEAAWFIVTSANLSKAAWGAFEKNCTQLMIRSYEIGVLFLPKYFGKIKLTTNAEEAISSSEHLFPLPYDLPLTRYDSGDRPWMVDLPCIELPDVKGEMWCPSVDDL